MICSTGLETGCKPVLFIIIISKAKAASARNEIIVSCFRIADINLRLINSSTKFGLSQRKKRIQLFSIIRLMLGNYNIGKTIGVVNFE